MKAEILKIAGVKDEASFYKKFPTEEAFMAKHGEQFKKAQQGTNILPIDISQKSDSLSPVFNTKKIVNYQPGVSNSKMGSGFYLYSRNQSEPGFNPERDREFVKQTEMEAVQRTPQWREFMQSKKPIIDNIVSMEDGGYIPIAQEGTMMGPSNQSNNFYQNNNPYFTTNPGATSINNPAIGLDTTMPTNPKAGFSDYLGAAGSIVSGFDMLGQEKTKRREAKQARELSEVLLKASNSTDIDALRPKQYVRPEDNPTQPNQLFPTNGVGTNVLAKNGKNIPTYHDYEDFTIAQNGANFLNSVNPGDITALTSLASTGFGNNGGSQIGGGFGQIAGMATGYPGASELVKLGGTVIGGLFGDNGSAARDQKTAQRNYDMIAANQMNKDMQATNRAFMQDGGVMPISDELETHWGGYQEEISENPYLPNDGKTVMFRGQSHDDGGIGVTYGNNPVEVEGGEPAVVIPNSQGEENLTVFGNLNIPEQFAKVIGDDKAKGMKFKNYIAQLSKKEEKHSSSLKKSTQEIDTLDMTTPYDKLKFSTLQAKSNTKAIAQAALNSMSDKYTRNRLENKTLGIQENMYNYRFDDKGRAINFNPLFQANEHNIYSPNANEPITQVPVKDANGKIVGYQQVGGNSDNTGTQASIQTTTETTTKTPYSFYKPMQPGEGVDTSVGTYKNGGKVSKKKYTNGSIVSSMKRC